MGRLLRGVKAQARPMRRGRIRSGLRRRLRQGKDGMAVLPRVAAELLGAQPTRAPALIEGVLEHPYGVACLVEPCDDVHEAPSFGFPWRLDACLWRAFPPRLYRVGGGPVDYLGRPVDDRAVVEHEGR